MLQEKKRKSLLSPVCPLPEPVNTAVAGAGAVAGAVVLEPARCAEHPSLSGSTQPFTWNPPPLQPSKFSSEDLPHESKVSSQNQAKQTNVTSVQNRSRENKAPPASPHPSIPQHPQQRRPARDIKSTPKSCKTMQHHAKSSKLMSCQNQANVMRKTRYSSGPYIDIRTRGIAFCSAKPCETSSPTICTDPESARPTKKTGPVKKEWQVGRDNDSRSRRPRTAAPALARGRMVPSC